jgi:nondiscriminating glutamyl-tRNA synthetase
MVGDFVILKSDNFPTYNFACVIDDYLMQINYILRGEEHLSNTYRQIMLYKTLNFTLPKFGHFSLIMGLDEEGKVSKLSKRHGAQSIDYFKEAGYLKSALVNYLVLLGWSHETQKEIFDINELISNFTLDRISKSPSIFDWKKLDWINGIYLRALSDSEKIKIGEEYLSQNYKTQNKNKLDKIILSVWNHLKCARDIINETKIYFEKPEISKEFLEKINNKNIKGFLSELHDKLDKFDNITGQNLANSVKELSKIKNLEAKQAWMALRIALTGMEHGPELVNIIEILDKKEILDRIHSII